MQAHAGGVAIGLGDAFAVLVEQVQAGADAKGLADVARHRLHGRAIPLHPVELPDVPEMWVAHRGIGDAVVAVVKVVAKYGVGDTAECIGTTKAFLGRVKATMPVVECSRQQAVEHLFEFLAQLITALLVLVAQHLMGEATEFQRVVVSEGHAHAQRLAEATAAQGGYGGCQRMQGGAAIDAHGLALVAQLTGMAGSAADIEKVLAALAVLMPGEADGQVAGVECTWLLPGIGEKAEAGQVIETGELFRAEGHFQRSEPVVAQAFYRGALRCVVVSLALLLAPLLQIMQLVWLLVGRQVGVGHVVQHHRQTDQRQQDNEFENTAEQTHRNILVAFLLIGSLCQYCRLLARCHRDDHENCAITHRNKAYR